MTWLVENAEDKTRRLKDIQKVFNFRTGNMLLIKMVILNINMD